MSIQIAVAQDHPPTTALLSNLRCADCDRTIIGCSRRAVCRQTFIEEIVMKLNSKSGATLAAAAATLFLAGTVATTGSTPANAAMGKCMAGNACKGQSACKGGANSCKGLNSCKGTGFSMASPKQCASADGLIVKG
jgi:hypothetical protein